MNAVVPQKQSEPLGLEVSALMVLIGTVLCLGSAIASQLWLPHADLPYGAVMPVCFSVQFGRVDMWWNRYVDMAVAQARAPRINATCVAAVWLPFFPDQGRERIFDLAVFGW